MNSDTIKTFISENIESLPSLVAEIIKELRHPLILLIGEMGSGKTTLVKEILKQLGSEDSGSSPSYALINEYKIEAGKLYHLDLYRLNSVQEAFALGIEDIMYSGSHCIIEWPQLIMDYIEPPYHVIQINISADNNRSISFK